MCSPVARSPSQLVSRRRLLRAAGAGALFVASPAIVRAQSVLTEPGRRGLYFPTGMPRVNRTHRLAASLCFAALAQQGTAGIDLFSGLSASGVGSTVTPHFRPAVVGQAMFFGNGVNPNDAAQWVLPIAYSPIVTSNGSGTGDFTMLTVANPPSAATQNFLFCQRNGSSLVQANIAANRNLSSQSTGTLSFITFNGTFVGAVASSAVDGNWHAFMGMRAGTTCSIWKDGAQLATGTGTVQQVKDSGTVIGYGGLIGDTTNSVGANCGIAFCAAWNRALAADEALELGLDPGCFLLWPEDDLMATIGAAGGGGGGSTNYMPFFAPQPF